MYEFLIDDERLIENVTEWAKKEACREKAKKLNIVLDPEFVNELIDKELEKERDK